MQILGKTNGSSTCIQLESRLNILYSYETFFEKHLPLQAPSIIS